MHLHCWRAEARSKPTVICLRLELQRLLAAVTLCWPTFRPRRSREACLSLFGSLRCKTPPSISLSVTISACFRIEFWPAWLSPRMRLSSPDHAPLIARTRVLAICSFCRFSSYNTASGRFYQPGETFMTHLTYS